MARTMEVQVGMEVVASEWSQEWTLQEQRDYSDILRRRSDFCSVCIESEIDRQIDILRKRARAHTHTHARTHKHAHMCMSTCWLHIEKREYRVAYEANPSDQCTSFSTNALRGGEDA